MIGTYGICNTDLVSAPKAQAICGYSGHLSGWHIGTSGAYCWWKQSGTHCWSGRSRTSWLPVHHIVGGPVGTLICPISLPLAAGSWITSRPSANVWAWARTVALTCHSVVAARRFSEDSHGNWEAFLKRPDIFQRLIYVDFLMMVLVDVLEVDEGQEFLWKSRLGLEEYRQLLRGKPPEVKPLELYIP